MKTLFALALAALLGVACIDSSGGDRFYFLAAAAGPSDATPGVPLVFVNAYGFRVSLSRARVHVGAVYLNQARPLGTADDTHCYLHGTYSAQVTDGRDIDALDPSLQYLPVVGEATRTRALSGEVWLNRGAVNARNDGEDPVVDLAGEAERDGVAVRFEARITIGANRLRPPKGPETPGQYPLCRERIVGPIPIDVLPTRGGALVVRIDPRVFVRTVDFSALPAADADGVRRFDDRRAGQAENSLWQGIRTREGAYGFTWTDGGT